MKKTRLDQLLVAQGLAETRSKAQAYIMAGLVYLGEQKLDKSGQMIADDAEITVRGKEHPWVSRGGMKLAKALTEYKLDVNGITAMDVGSSTGGFTDVLLTNGATKVYAVDVGTGQLDPKIRNDARVVVMEQTNAKHLTRALLNAADKDLPLEGGGGREATGGGAALQSHTNAAPPSQPSPLKGEGVIDLIVCDASFISLTKVLPAALALTKANAKLVALIKPQFEVGKAEVSRGKGVITDPKLHEWSCDTVQSWLVSVGWTVHGITQSPVKGPKGNTEFLLYATKSNT